MNNTIPPNLPTEEIIPEVPAPILISPEEIPAAIETPTTGTDDKYKKAMEYGQKGILGALVFVFLVIGIFGAVKIIPYIISSLASVGISLSSVFTAKEALTISVSTDPIIPGQQFSFSVNHSGETEEGTYTWSYACAGAVLRTRTLSADTVIPCGKEFRIQEGEKITLISPEQNNNGVVFVVNFLGVNGKKLRAEKQIGAGTVAPEAMPPSSYIKNPPSTGNGGRPDFSIAVLETGIATQANTIIPTTMLSANDRAGVKFVITNAGGTATGAWQFEAIIPNQNPVQVYHSPLQQSLAPGDSIQFVLGFDGTNGTAVGNILIQVDDSDSVKESNEDNNIVTVSFTRTGGGYVAPTYNYNQTYYPYQDTSYYNYSPNGNTDLALLSVNPGFIDPRTGSFSSASGFSNDTYRPAVQIEVENRGSGATGTWDTDIVIIRDYNSSNSSYYNSRRSTIHQPNQISLANGERRKIVFEIPASIGRNTIEVILDPNNRIYERNEGNNEDDAILQIY